MKMQCSVDSISWLPHHFAKGVRIKPMITQKEDRLDVTCVLVEVPAGVEVPEHVHETQDDILYPLSGKGVMWIEGEGEFTIEPGLIIRVPKGTKHKIVKVTETLLIYDVFCPALI
ncbi:MAG TPA: cupin domain-containing protein [Deltaproteobacteria bacterium]|nr:cupin domain-containing protein [Deltaproteobacteria bacterium]